MATRVSRFGDRTEQLERVEGVSKMLQQRNRVSNSPHRQVPERNKCIDDQTTHKNVHGGCIDKSPMLEITQVSISSEWINKLWHVLTMEHCSANRQNCGINIGNSVDEFPKPMGPWQWARGHVNNHCAHSKDRWMARPQAHAVQMGSTVAAPRPPPSP